MVLDGLEQVVKTAVKSARQINFVRYAEDFIVTARHRSDLEKFILPAIKNVKAFLGKVRNELRKKCRGQNASQVIARLNPKIRGWANYHRHGVSLERSIYVDHQIFEEVFRFLKRSHPDSIGCAG